MDALQLAIVATAVGLCLTLGATVLFRNTKSATHRTFAIMTLAMAVWIVMVFICDQPAFFAYALPINRGTVAIAVLFSVSLVVFALTFPHRRFEPAWGWIAFVVIPGFAIAALAALTPVFITGVDTSTGVSNPAITIWFWLLLVWAGFVLVALCISLLQTWQASSGTLRRQLSYLYLGLGSFFFVAMILTSIIPLVTGSYALARYTPLACLLFLVPTATAIVRHRLLDVGIGTVRSAVYAVLLGVLGASVLVAADTWRVSLQADTGIDAKFVVFGVGLVAVLGFQPLKRGLEAASDRMLFQRTYDPARVLGELSRVVTATLELEAIANFLANELAGDMRLSFASVAYHRGASTHIVTAGAAPVVDLRRVAALSKGELVVVDELDEVDPGFVLLEEARVRVLVPITCEGVEIGVIVLGEKQSGVVFSDSDLNFLTLIASEACVAMRNAQLFEEKTARMRELEALNGLTAVLVSDQDVGTLLERALSEAVSVTQAETGSIMMFDAERRLMTIAAGLGIDDEIMRSTQVRMGQGISGWVAQSRRAVVLVDENDPRFKEHAVRGEISSAIAAPIIFKDEVIGVLNLNRVSSPEPFTKENLNVVTAFTGQLAVAIENGQLYEDLESTFLGTIAALAAAVDAKDPYTFGHSTEVTEHAVRIAKQMGLSDEEVHTIRIAGMLHDIGKIGIDRSILHKPGRLSDEERAIINTHPTIGADILAPLDFLKDAIPLILFHHERYNGGGYPSGISGMAIPLGARIISVADSFNAMVSDRPYRKGIPLEEALGELERNAGTQFEPEVVTAFLAERAERNAKRAELRVVQTAQTRRSQAPAIKPPVAEQAPPMAIEG